MSREWFDEFLDFLKNPPNSDLSPLALPYYQEIQKKIESAFEDEEYSDLLCAKMIAVMESPLFLGGQVKGRRLPSAPQNPRYKTHKIIDWWPTILSHEGFVEMISRTLLSVDLSKDTSYLKNIAEQELNQKIESLMSAFATTTRKDKFKTLNADLEFPKARHLKKFPASFKTPDWQEMIAIFFRRFVPDPNKSELREIIFNFLNALGYKANKETIRDKLKLL